MRIQLSDHFNYRRLFRFTLPSVVMMVFTSVYGLVDGLFVSNCVGSNALSSINIVYPLVMIVGAVGFMLGTGGSAEVSKALGQGKHEDACQYFTTLILTLLACGVCLSALCIAFIRPLVRLLGASALLLEDSVTYGTILLLGSPFFMLQSAFQTFFVAAEKPKLGLGLTVLSGVTNIVLDFLFIFCFHWGVAGAALATVAGYVLGGVIPLLYFFLPNTSLLRFAKTHIYPGMLLKSCVNGSSEMVSNVSMSVVAILYNWKMMDLIGEDGVAAYTAIMYVNFLFLAIFIGFVIGTAPVISFHYGAGNQAELKNLFRKSVFILFLTSLSMFFLSQVCASWIAGAFSGGNLNLAAMVGHGFRIHAVSFLFSSVGIFGSAFFTALCNGAVSALISFLRALVFPVLFIFLLPLFWKLDGVWISAVATEGLAGLLTAGLLWSNRKKYGYI